jgi:hypothetical protein
MDTKKRALSHPLKVMNDIGERFRAGIDDL